LRGPEGEHNDIYRRLSIPTEVIKPVRTVRPAIVTQTELTPRQQMANATGVWKLG